MRTLIEGFLPLAIVLFLCFGPDALVALTKAGGKRKRNNAESTKKG